MARVFRLSVEELAYILAESGHPETAQSLLQESFSTELAAEDVMQRLLAAGHSLMARELLLFDSNLKPTLSEDARWLARVLLDVPFSIRYTFAVPEGQKNLTYHFIDGKIVEHRVEFGVVHALSEYADSQIVIDSGISFFQIEQEPPFNAAEGELAQTLLSQAQTGADLAQIRQALAQSALPASTQEMLAQDFANARYRGSALRIEYRAGEAVSDFGFLLLRGPERLWLLKPVQRPEGAVVIVMPGSIATFQREVAALMA